MTEKTCKTCLYFPCTKPQCEIGQKGCNDYESTVNAEIKKIGENNGQTKISRIRIYTRWKNR